MTMKTTRTTLYDVHRSAIRSLQGRGEMLHVRQGRQDHDNTRPSHHAWPRINRVADLPLPLSEFQERDIKSNRDSRGRHLGEMCPPQHISRRI